MSGRRGAPLAAGIFAGIVSLTAAAWSGILRADTLLLAASKPAQLAPVPDEFAPANMVVPALQPALTNWQKDRIRTELWRSPLDQQLVDYLYVDAVRTGQDASASAIAKILAVLGWRYTPAQQNLMLRAAIDGRFTDVVDRADALLRRQKLTDQAMTMLTAMEAIPQVHNLVMETLLSDPMWRYDYLLRIGPQSAPRVVDARFRTLRILLRTPDSVSRAELAPALQALVAQGRGRDADALWTLKNGPRRTDNILRDGTFRAAAQLAGDEVAIPFEWQLNQNLGYSADTGGRGVIVNWDGRGIPVFMRQLVPVEPGRSYMLSIMGKTDTGTLQTLLSPSLDCGTVKLLFNAIGGNSDAAHFRSVPVPKGCNMATIEIGGDVDTGRRAVSMDIARIVLQPTN